MKTAAVIHPDFVVSGGAEAVCFATLEALQDEYDVTLVTFTRPDFDRLNGYYDTAVDPERITVRTVGRVVPTLYDRVGKRFGVLLAAYFNRVVGRDLDGYDVVLSTKDEFALDDAIQYVHFPRFHRRRHPDGLGHGSVTHHLYDALCRTVAGFDDTALTDSVLVTNSTWTASVIEDVYGVRPDVVHPPVHTARFEPSSAATAPTWADREDGFVTVGRISPDKNLLRTIDIVGEVIEDGHDVHLHIVGPGLDGQYADYADRVLARAAEYDSVHVEGELPFDRLVELLQHHKYGIHGKEYEHFGMVVAEMVAAGIVPFVPATGGQTDIVDGCSELVYTDADDAVAKLSAVVSDREKQDAIRASLPDARERYGRERFEAELRNIVAEHLAERRDHSQN